MPARSIRIRLIDIQEEIESHSYEVQGGEVTRLAS
jgi:hypothetical protein